MSASDISRAQTIRRAPSSYQASAASALATLACVLTCSATPGNWPAGEPHGAQVGDDERVGPAAPDELQIVGELGQVALPHDDVAGNVHGNAPLVRPGNDVGQLVSPEVRCASAHAEPIRRQIDGVGPEPHSVLQLLAPAGRRQQLHGQAHPAGPAPPVRPVPTRTPVAVPPRPSSASPRHMHLPHRPHHRRPVVRPAPARPPSRPHPARAPCRQASQPVRQARPDPPAPPAPRCPAPAAPRAQGTSPSRDA